MKATKGGVGVDADMLTAQGPRSDRIRKAYTYHVVQSGRCVRFSLRFVRLCDWMCGRWWCVFRFLDGMEGMCGRWWHLPRRAVGAVRAFFTRVCD